MPAGADNRHILIGSFGNLQVFVFDPYSVALSKLDRGFDSDIEDVTFLLRRRFVDPQMLNTLIEHAAMKATEFDLNPSQMRSHLLLAQKPLMND